MSNKLPSNWDSQFCRRVVNRLRDGLPPPVEAIHFLSLGTESYLERARQGMKQAARGQFDCAILVGPYGIGKSHLLRRVRVLAEAEGFATRYLELGGGVYFNKPEEIARQLAGSEYRDDLPQGRGYYTDRKFIDQLNYVAYEERQNGRGAKGLVILLDELENSFDWSNLPLLPSRIKAYRYLDILFNGRSEKSLHRRRLEYIYLMIAVTPGILDRAMNEEPGYSHWNAGWVANPAVEWKKRGLPDQIEITPLGFAQARDLLERIRSVHGQAFNWDAARGVSDEQLGALALSWLLVGANRDERQLVKALVEGLEVAEQER